MAALSHGDPKGINPQDQSLHEFQQVLDKIDFRVVWV